MIRRIGLLLVLVLVAASRLPGQTLVRAPGGTLVGLVRDSASGEPVGYALVVLEGKDQRVFASEAGRFTLTGLGGGAARIRVQQIGYRARILSLQVNTRQETGGEPGLVVDLTRHALVLPEIVVEGSSCFELPEVGVFAPEASGIIGQAFANAERILTLERKFPFLLEYQRVVTLLDSTYNRIDGRVDTIRRDSRTYVPYRAGKVFDRPGTPMEKVAIFTSSDIAGSEFQKTHCFWYGGRDSVEGFPGYRIDFAPRPEVKSADWAGSILIDSASMILLRTEARLVNIPSGTNFYSAICTLFYQPILPSLPQEFQTRCVSSQKRRPPHYRVERWLLVNRRFVGKTPLQPSLPP